MVGRTNDNALMDITNPYHFSVPPVTDGTFSTNYTFFWSRDELAVYYLSLPPTLVGKGSLPAVQAVNRYIKEKTSYLAGCSKHELQSFLLSWDTASYLEELWEKVADKRD